MITCFTSGIKLSVESAFRDIIEEEGIKRYIFAYRLRLVNESGFTVALKRCHWYLAETLGKPRSMTGRPPYDEASRVLEPGDGMEYVARCDIGSDMGVMFGRYEVERCIDGETITLEIPRFDLLSPYRFN